MIKLQIKNETHFQKKPIQEQKTNTQHQNEEQTTKTKNI